MLWKNDHFLASQGKKMDLATAKKFIAKGKVRFKDLKSQRTGSVYEATIEMVTDREGKVQFQLHFPKSR